MYSATATDRIISSSCCVGIILPSSQCWHGRPARRFLWNRETRSGVVAGQKVSGTAKVASVRHTLQISDEIQTYSCKFSTREIIGTQNFKFASKFPPSIWGGLVSNFAFLDRTSFVWEQNFSPFSGSSKFGDGDSSLHCFPGRDDTDGDMPCLPQYLGV